MFSFLAMAVSAVALFLSTVVGILVVLALVGATTGVATAFIAPRGTGRTLPLVDDSRDPDDAEQVINDLYELVLHTEGSARKLGAQVAETLASTARIASQTSTGSRRADTLSTEVVEGAAAM
ncbi:MAG TPA: hypothetical protein VJ932_04270, partial [Alkalispirochaeta sp.]|nr:hypothetical protein [Alkalispirochaeta sp.]